jgi:hypothetical protein
LKKSGAQKRVFMHIFIETASEEKFFGIQAPTGIFLFALPRHYRGFLGPDFFKKISVTLLVCYCLIYRMIDSQRLLRLR